SPWGLQVTPLLDPNRFWEVLTHTSPDLLILDVEMPGFNGIELCQVVRNDPHWGNLPILFLTAHQDVETLVQAFAAGGDDYIRKPILEPELIARVLNRLEPGQIRQHQLISTFMT
ncbi:MAG TPA: response regulator, partial [Coleofasciculaceae cyanobacterium]